jgi:hypothetical protein
MRENTALKASLAILVRVTPVASVFCNLLEQIAGKRQCSITVVQKHKGGRERPHLPLPVTANPHPNIPS